MFPKKSRSDGFGNGSTTRPRTGNFPWATSRSESWDDYMAAYEDMIRNTSTPEAPWFVVPADNKWFTRLVVAAEVVEALDRLNLKFPSITGDARGELAKARKILMKSD